jgi:hypothetical protein
MTADALIRLKTEGTPLDRLHLRRRSARVGSRDGTWWGHGYEVVQP